MKHARKSLSHGVAQAYRWRLARVGSSDDGAYGHRRLKTAARSQRVDGHEDVVRDAVPCVAHGMGLDERFTNWANVSSGRRGDTRDAALIDAAWQCVSTQHRTLLRMHYVWHANRAFICRRLKIRHRPWHVFEDELEQAKTAVAEALACGSRQK